jgi:predicted nucleotidyltransferase
MAPPKEVLPLIDKVQNDLHAEQIWLFGSRARGDNRPDSDWDLVAVIDDDAPERFRCAEAAWKIANTVPIRATLLCTTCVELKALWGVPNTIGYDLAREGILLNVNDHD